MSPTDSTTATLLLSKSDVAAHLSIDDVLETVEAVFRAHGNRKVAMPPKITLDLRDHDLEAWHNAMPGYVAPLGAAGIKWAGGYKFNPSRFGLPYVMALITIQDPETGYPLAVMDGGHITNVRTGAAAAICAKYYALANSETVGMIGAGVQARTVTDALMRTHSIKQIRVADISEEASNAFAADVSARYGIDVIPSSLPDAVAGADIVATVTYADEPLVRGEWLKPGATLLSLGSYQECDDQAVLGADKIVVDSWEQCAHRGELKRFAESGRLNRDTIHGEVGDTVAGILPGRESDRERILVVPIGLGTHDVALGRLVYDRSNEAGAGTRFDFYRG